MKSNLNIIGFKKILIGFIIIIIIALFNAVFSSGIIQRNKTTITKITKGIHPYIETLDEFNLMATKSKMLITNWVYMPQGDADKKALVDLHEKEYQAVKEKLTEYAKASDNKDDLENMQLVFKNFEHLLTIEQIIMQELVTFYDTRTPQKNSVPKTFLKTKSTPVQII